jgi:uncharacterized RDD family membrane protein YckC
MISDLKIAESATRVKALLLDFLFGFFLPSAFLQVIFSVSFKDQGTANFLSGFAILLTMLIYWVLTPYFSNGQTLGKSLLRLRIIDLSGRRLGMAQLLKRNLAYVITVINSVKRGKLVFDENGLLDHDRACNTTVISIV